MDDLRKAAVMIYSLGSAISDNLQKVALVGFTGDVLPPSIVPYEIDVYSSPDKIPADRLALAAIPYAYGEAIPAHLKQVANLGYVGKVLSVKPGNLIGYWPLWEASGDIAYDVSGNERNGTHSGVTLGQVGIGDGRTCPSYDGSNDYTSIHSVGLASAFNDAQGTVMVWAKVANAGVWTDGVTRYALYLFVDSSNRVYLRRANWQAGGFQLAYRAGNVESTLLISDLSTTDWICFALTWDKAGDAVKVYLNGTQQGSTQTGLGNWGGTLTMASIGADAGPSSVWNGCLAHIALWEVPLNDREIAYLARVR